jgi:hypothetical protein
MGRVSPAAAAVGGSADGDGGKSSWPELVGRHPVDAVAVIKSQRDDVLIKLLGAGDAQPPDFDAHRVCLFLDGNLTVVRTPVVG